MLRKELTVRNRAGLHTRPAAMLVRTIARFTSDCMIRKGNIEVNGKSIIGVMTLAAEQGSTLTFLFDGDDAEAAAGALEQLFATGFGEKM